MKLTHYMLASLLLSFFFACQSQQQEESSAASETQAEPVSQDNDEDWVTLFDGSDVSQWKNYNEEGFGWEVVNGELTTDGSSGDIITKDTYENYILEFDWKIERGGNSGVIYNTVEDKKYVSTHETGPEYQLIDAENYKEVHDYALEDNQVTAANYALHVPSSQPVKPAGEYNHSKIVVDQGKVEHWLNGEKVVEYELWTAEWKEMVAQTKFKDMPDYGKAKSGHIALQGHGDQVWFKEIKIKEL
ncbi:3-keto-disaccharide hydrolase [Catalinimonas niigatensis]|uniref:3-keto-disaccharide hydrolase n=1 Tax=Catalinimonas niigatensis TaxID=1397264 RepID=UPI00266715D8|nr:DUF1080 domain-containing protein [Catalinimonas niigatensis]WPP50643.1 DUF1080 domain-containing protein [Catalinimonas niigatensis]